MNDKVKEIKLELRKHSAVLNDAFISASFIDHIKKELVFKLTNELNFVVNEVVAEGYKTYEVSVNFICIDIPKNEEELLGIIKTLIEKYSKKFELKK